MASHFHTLPVADIRREAEDAVSIRLTVPPALTSQFTFRPGQHLTLRRQVDGVEHRRSYSLCSGVDDGEWRIGIREVPGGLFSTWANHELKPGDLVECLPPDGSFVPVLEESHTRHYLLIAGGSGITPVLSIASSVLTREPHSRVTLLYANRRLATTMFRETLVDLKNRYLQRFVLYPLFSREPQEQPLADGRLDAARLREYLERLIPPADIDEVFLCGPNAMLDELLPVLREAGVDENRLHLERFGTDLPPPAIERAHATGPQASVVVIADGVTRELALARDGVSILEAARAAGLDLPYSCKSGVCSTCRSRLKEGTVEMTRNFALMPSDLEAGYILTCQAHPTSERVVVSFDER